MGFQLRIHINMLYENFIKSMARGGVGHAFTSTDNTFLPYFLLSSFFRFCSTSDIWLQQKRFFAYRFASRSFKIENIKEYLNRKGMNMKANDYTYEQKNI